MKKPIILILDDDQAVIRALRRDVRDRYKKDFRVMALTSAEEALQELPNLKNKGEEIALFLSDQVMPQMLGVDFLEKAVTVFPNSKRVLLTAYSDTDAAIKGINAAKLDYYLLKPWDPPEESLFPVLDDVLEEWEKTFVPPFIGLRLVGYQWSPLSHTLKDFLAGNLIPFKWLDIETHKEAEDIIQRNQLSREHLPVVVLENGEILTTPQPVEVGQKLGMSKTAEQEVYDVAIIGAGPAGLAAAVYGGSEGLNTLLIEKRAPGGQAGTSSRIENYLGFPNGLSGADLSRRALTQATRFGIEYIAPQEVVGLEVKNGYKVLTLKDGAKVNSKAIIISTGVSYRKHPAAGIDDFTGAGIYYGAANNEAFALKGKDVYVVGGGNSAGQAAMYLSRYANKVVILIRKPDLSSSMSQYLIDQIGRTDNIVVQGHTDLTHVAGSDRLESVTLKNNQTGDSTTEDAAALFIFIGAKPITDWLDFGLIKNDRGYIETGPALKRYDNFAKVWKLDREPFLLETCSPGIFAAGDVRAGTMNRVASAVGEGSMSIKFVHEFLAS